MGLLVPLGLTLAKYTPTVRAKPAHPALLLWAKGWKSKNIIVLSVGIERRSDRAAAERVLHGGLENVVAQGLWGTETACQVKVLGGEYIRPFKSAVGRSGVYDLDIAKRMAVMTNSVGEKHLPENL